MAKGKILVVEDGFATREILADILTEEGYTVATAETGSAAIKKVEKGELFDLLILDIKLPDINGVEVLKAIKKINPQIVAIMMTAYSVENLIKEALELGASTCIYKPFDIEQVLDLIKKIIDEKRS